MAQSKKSKVKSRKRQSSSAKKSGAKASSKKSGGSQSGNQSSRQNVPSHGPIGAILRWARLHRHLSFILGLTRKESTPALKKRLRLARDMARKGSVGVPWASINLQHEEDQARLKKQPYTVADLPTHGQQDFVRLFSRKVPKASLAAVLSALSYGVPLVIPGSADLENFRPLISARMLFKEGDVQIEKRFNEFQRVLNSKLRESFSLAEKPGLTLIDLASKNGRPSVLEGVLRRQLTSRTKWLDRAGERTLAKWFVKGDEDDQADLVFLDVLPLVLTHLNPSTLKCLGDLVSQPLGLLTFGLCPALCLNLKEDKD